jgi:hypothetical protein
MKPEAQLLRHPGRQMDRMELAIGDHRRPSPERQAGFEPAQQLLLQPQIRVAFVRHSHPAERQRPALVGDSQEEQIDRVVDHRPIHDDLELDPAPAAQLPEHLPRRRFERRERLELLALQQSLEAFDSRLELNPLMGHGPSCLRQRDAPAVGDPDD